jgi:hypothetical protein
MSRSRRASRVGHLLARHASCSATNLSAEQGPSGGLRNGDLVVGIVRRHDPVPCANCAVGEWDMCRNGQYTERGIKEIDGYMSERWRIEPEYAMKIDPYLGLLGVLLEPTTVVTKAWEQVVAVGQRAFWEPRTVLVTGAGPIGLLAALVGTQRGLDVHVLDRNESGPKPDLVRALGATYHSGRVSGSRFRAGRHRRVYGSWIGDRGLDPEDRSGLHRLPDRSRIRRYCQPGRRRCRGCSGPEEQCVGRQRERQQASLIQGD